MLAARLGAARAHSSVGVLHRFSRDRISIWTSMISAGSEQAQHIGGAPPARLPKRGSNRGHRACVRTGPGPAVRSVWAAAAGPGRGVC
jgi:hypothetical protein